MEPPDQFKKEYVLCRLQAIVNEITCMNMGILEKHILDNKFEIEFHNYCWGEKAKVVTTITMHKKDLSLE